MDDSERKADEIQKKIEEIGDKIKDQQIKYSYYIVALCVASVAYSINRTIDHKLNLLLIVWALPLTSWGISIFFGLEFLKQSFTTLDSVIALFGIRKSLWGNKLPDETKNILYQMDANWQITVNAKLNKERLFLKWQYITFFIGVGLFIIWHIMEIIVKTFAFYG